MTALPFIPAGEPDEELLTRLFGPDDPDCKRACLRGFGLLDVNGKPVLLDEPNTDTGIQVSPLAEERTTTQIRPAGTPSDGDEVQELDPALPPSGREAASVSATDAPPAAVSYSAPRGLPGLAAWLLTRLVPIDWRLQ